MNDVRDLLFISDLGNHSSVYTTEVFRNILQVVPHLSLIFPLETLRNQAHPPKGSLGLGLQSCPHLRQGIFGKVRFELELGFPIRDLFLHIIAGFLAPIRI